MAYRLWYDRSIIPDKGQVRYGILIFLDPIYEQQILCQIVDFKPALI